MFPASVCSGGNFRGNPQPLPVPTSAPACQSSQPGRACHAKERQKFAFLQVMTENLQNNTHVVSFTGSKGNDTPARNAGTPSRFAGYPPFYKSRSAPISRTGYSTSSRPGVHHPDTTSQENPPTNRRTPKGMAPARTHNEDHTTSASAGAFFCLQYRGEGGIFQTWGKKSESNRGIPKK